MEVLLMNVDHLLYYDTARAHYATVDVVRLFR